MSTDILDTSGAFFKAAASYFGLPLDQVILGSQRATVDGVFRLTLDIALTPADLIGITRRMEQIEQDRAVMDEPQPGATSMGIQASQEPSYEDVARNPQAFRDAGQELDKLKQLEDAGVAYGNLSAAEKSQYGSRFKFVLHIARTMDGIEALSTGREVKHIDTEQETDDKVEFVWLTPEQATDAQKQFASEVDSTGKYAINVQMLTAEQRTALGMDEGGLPG